MTSDTSDNPMTEPERSISGRVYGITVAEVSDALQSSGGIIALAARRLGVSRQTVYDFLADFPAAADASVEARESLKDLAETNVLVALRNADMITTRWYLETIGRDRGYTKRSEVTGPNGGPIPYREEVFDLSKLSDQELITLHELQSKARDSGLGDPPGDGATGP